MSLLAAAALGLSMHKFSCEGDHFVLDGKPFIIRSGEMHYPRVPRPYWRDRFKKMRAMGLNTVCTYVFWNLHEAQPGKFDFNGNLDLAEYVREAQSEGLFVLLRPGPYVCSEWEWGGFPYWLAKIPGIKIRQNDPLFLDRTKTYLNAVGKQIGGLTVAHGGPILMCQVENEYGSFGKDHVYMSAIRDQIRGAGIDCQLYTSDGPGQGMLNGGTLPDCLSVCNFGGGAEGAFQEFDKFRQNVPKMCGEYWAGWFDHWGADHAKTNPEGEAEDIEWMLSHGVSFNIYMVHGGTSWGWMNGANASGPAGYEPDVSSYDYDAPIAEDGRLTEKWQVLKETIAKHISDKLPAPPPEAKRIAIPPFALHGSIQFYERSNIVKTEKPMHFEELDQPYGFVMYETRIQQGGKLEVRNLQDRAMVYVDGGLAGILERRLKETNLVIPAGTRLSILVENLGRINFARPLLNERKGFDSATLNGAELTGWTQKPEDFASPAVNEVLSRGPTVYRGTFVLTEVGDTFFDMRGWNKGNLWVNGHHIGRYWSIGAQQSQYVPGCWLKKGKNQVEVLELLPDHEPMLKSAGDPIYEVHH
jgi:beta-galactosidase